MIIYNCVFFVCFVIFLVDCDTAFGQRWWKEAQQCELIHPFFGGTVFYSNNRHINAEAYYRCDEAYSMFPKEVDHSTCTTNLTWEPAPPQCFKKANVLRPRKGYVCNGNKDLLLHSESSSVCCNQGFEMYSDRYLDKTRVIVINNNGTLEPEVLRCVKARCDTAVLQRTNVAYRNGSKVTEKIPHGSAVSLSCEDGYQFYREDELIKSQQIRKCVKGKIKYLPKCEEEKCTVPKVVRAEMLSKAANIYEHGENITIICDVGYHFDDGTTNEKTKLETTCHLGEWIEPIPEECQADQCSLQLQPGASVLVNSRLLKKEDGDIQTFASGSNLQIECRGDYIMKDVFSGKRVKNIKRYAVCVLGNWTHEFSCYTDGCQLEMQDGAEYYITGKTEIITISKEMEHTTRLKMKCTDKFDLFNDNGIMFYDKSFMPELLCYQGNWLNNHICKKRCDIPYIENGRLLKDGEVVTEKENISHGESVHFECDNDEHKTGKAAKCNNGKIEHLKKCPGVRTFSRSTERVTLHNNNGCTLFTDPKYTYYGRDGYEKYHGDIIPDGTSLTVTCEEIDLYMFYTIDDDDYSDYTNSSSDETITCMGGVLTHPYLYCPEGCKVSKDPRYIYTDSSGFRKDDGSIIPDGTSLTVTCKEIDLYEFYTSYDDDSDYTNSSSDVTMTCIGGVLTPLKLKCPEVSPDTCKELEHGSVKEENGYYIVSCDKGYSLDLIVPEKSQCTCENGKLISVYGKQEPSCKPDVIYYISVKSFAHLPQVSQTNAYITMHGFNRTTERLYLSDTSSRFDLEETIVEAKDVRPIIRVEVGHSSLSACYLEFVSIYTETFEEYYVFKPDEPVLVNGDKSVVLSRSGYQTNCVLTFDAGRRWYPKWQEIVQGKYFYDTGRQKSERYCKQACLTQNKVPCRSVLYNHVYGDCYCFGVSEKSFFTDKRDRWHSLIYMPVCK